MTRLAGLETEYGCLAADPATIQEVIRRVRDWLFLENRYGLIDQHQRDWDEPAGNGGFLFNGGRAYIDMGHLELCTAECLSLQDLINHDRGQDALLNEGLAALDWSHRAGFVRNNVDHYSGATFGCHENFLVRRTAPLSERNVLSLLAFLTVRVLLCGAGKVGTSPGIELRAGGEPIVEPLPFQISQRADYIQNELFEWVQFNRAIINTRDEPLADARKFRRLHLLHGDTSVLPTTLALKIGTTALVLDLLEADRLPAVALADSVGSFRELSRHPDGPWRVPLAGGEEMDALELLMRFQEAAKSEFAGRDAETDGLLADWAATVEALASQPESLVGRVDWITKRWLFAQFLEAEGLSWSAPWLRSQDLEFHHIDPLRNLAWPLADADSRWEPTPAQIIAAKGEPPFDTRAAIRSRVMRLLAAEGRGCYVDWEVVDADGVNPLMLLNPFDSDVEVAERWVAEVRATPPPSRIRVSPSR